MKTLRILLLFLFTSSSLFAQDKVLFHGGFYGGMSTSQVSGDNLSGFKKVGGYAGAFVNIGFTKSSYLQIEASYIQKGSRSVSKTTGVLAYSLNLQYFEFPVLYQYRFQGKLHRFGLEAGVGTGFLLKTTGVEKVNGYDVINPRPFNRLDLSAMGGFSIKLMERDKFNLSTVIRGSQSIIPIRAHESGAVYRLNRGQYNTVLGLVLMFEFM